MNTGFACPACYVPLVLTYTATTSADELTPDVNVATCPNPFCRADLPARRRDMALTYALVGTVPLVIEPPR